MKGPREKKKKVLAVSSGGGHWVELLRLAPAFEGHEVAFVTVDKAYRSEAPFGRFFVVNDATRWDKFKLMLLAVRVLWLILRLRPNVIVSTGAAPGYLAVRFGHLLGIRTVWIDSIANVERLSLSGRRIGPAANLWLTQWAHLARDTGPRYMGSVL